MENQGPQQPTSFRTTTAAASPAPLALPPTSLQNLDPPVIGDVVGPEDDVMVCRTTSMAHVLPLATPNPSTLLPSPLVKIWGPETISTHLRQRIMSILLGPELASWLMASTQRPPFSAHAHLPYAQSRLVCYGPDGANHRGKIGFASYSARQSLHCIHNQVGPLAILIRDMWLGSGTADPPPFFDIWGAMPHLRLHHTGAWSPIGATPGLRDPSVQATDIPPPPFSARLVIIDAHFDRPITSFPMTFYTYHWECLPHPACHSDSPAHTLSFTQGEMTRSLLPLDDPQGSPWEPDGYIRQCGRPSRHGFHAFPPQPGAPPLGRPSGVFSIPIPFTQLSAIEAAFRTGPHRVVFELGSPDEHPVAIIAGDTLSPGTRQCTSTRFLATPASVSGRVYTLRNPHNGHRPPPPSLPVVVASTDFSRRGYTPRGTQAHIASNIPFHHLIIHNPRCYRR